MTIYVVVHNSHGITVEVEAFPTREQADARVNACYDPDDQDYDCLWMAVEMTE